VHPRWQMNGGARLALQLLASTRYDPVLGDARLEPMFGTDGGSMSAIRPAIPVKVAVIVTARAPSEVRPFVDHQVRPSDNRILKASAAAAAENRGGSAESPRICWTKCRDPL